MKLYFVFDVESVGLHGEGFAVGGGVYLPNGSALSEFRYACPMSDCSGTVEDREWVKQNVPVLEITHRSAREMRKAFWDTWFEARLRGAVACVDCGWPVEAKFLEQCVADYPDERRWGGPYPLHEIASFIAACGLDPLATNERTPSELPRHDPLADSRQSARLLSEALASLGTPK